MEESNSLEEEKMRLVLLHLTRIPRSYALDDHEQLRLLPKLRLQLLLFSSPLSTFSLLVWALWLYSSLSRLPTAALRTPSMLRISVQRNDFVGAQDPRQKSSKVSDRPLFL